MGATAQERLEKRRINELEEKLRALQREMQSYKARTKRQMGKLRKDVRWTSDKEEEMAEHYDEEMAKERGFSQPKKDAPQTAHKCRKENCKSNDTILIPAGIRVIVLCKACEGKYTISVKESKNS